MFLRKACEDIFLSPSQKQQPVITTEWKKKIFKYSNNTKVLNRTLPNTGWQRNFGHQQDHSNVQAIEPVVRKTKDK